MDKWVPHFYVEHHQLATRNRSVTAVGTAPPGERLEILIDWSEKLSLEPNNSSTGAQYNKIGVVIAVCVYRGRGANGAQAETMVGLCEEPTNDVPHTHVFLKQIIEHFAKRSKEQGAQLKAVNIWSDGGQAHFKCAEGFVYTSHLLRYLRSVSENSAARLVWNFMQSYHGKGPYDAEGGLVKYRIRRAIFKRGHAFLGAKEVFEYCVCDPELTEAVSSRAGLNAQATFNILRRTFFFVAESDVEVFKYCTSPLFSCSGAVGAGELKSKDKVFCLRPDPNPEVVAFACQPAKLGLPPSMQPGLSTTTEPYQDATLNVIPGPHDAGFTGTWRHLSCACEVCLFEVPVDGVCTIYGKGMQAPPWVPYKVTRKPPAATKSTRNRNNSFLVRFVEFSIASCLQRGVVTTVDGIAAEVAGFMVQGLKVYKTLRGGSTLVRERFALTHWLHRWVLETHRVHATDPAAWALARADIGARVARSGWQPPQLPGVHGQLQLQAVDHIVKFIDTLVS